MGGSTSPPLDPSSPVDGGMRKRVCKACDRCRLKKSKCDGSSPCSRCKVDNAICVFGERKKSHDKVYPKGYVEMLEHQQSQLVTGLQELYRRLQTGEGWTGAPLKETSRGKPLTHDILERLGALKQENPSSPESFEDNFESLQNRLLANGAGFMQQREMSFDATSEPDQSPIFESVSHHKAPTFTNPFAVNQYPPTPPIGSPHPHMIKTSSPLKTQVPVTSTTFTNLTWQSEPIDMTASMEFDMACDTPMSAMDFQALQMAAQLYQDPSGLAINPCMTMKDWHPQDEQLQRFFQNPMYTQ